MQAFFLLFIQLYHTSFCNNVVMSSPCYHGITICFKSLVFFSSWYYDLTNCGYHFVFFIYFHAFDVSLEFSGQISYYRFTVERLSGSRKPFCALLPLPFGIPCFRSSITASKACSIMDECTGLKMDRRNFMAEVRLSVSHPTVCSLYNIYMFLSFLKRRHIFEVVLFESDRLRFVFVLMIWHNRAHI